MAPRKERTFGSRKKDGPSEYWRIHKAWYNDKIDLNLLRERAEDFLTGEKFGNQCRLYALHDWAVLKEDERQSYIDNAGKHYHTVRDRDDEPGYRLSAATRKAVDQTIFWSNVENYTYLPAPGVVITPNALPQDKLTLPAYLSPRMKTLGNNAYYNGDRIPGGHAKKPEDTEIDPLDEWEFLDNIYYRREDDFFSMAIQRWQCNTTDEIMIVKHTGYDDRAGFDDKFLWVHDDVDKTWFKEAYAHYLLSATMPPTRGVLTYVGSVVDKENLMVRIGMPQARYLNLKKLIEKRSMFLNSNYMDTAREVPAKFGRLSKYQEDFRRMRQGMEDKQYILTAQWLEMLETILKAGETDHLVLRDEMRNHIIATKIPEDFIWHVVKTIGTALQELHFQRYMHLDMKPENIIVGDALDLSKATPVMGGWCIETYLVDFGLATHTRDFRRDIRETGTPKYRAPEQRKVPDEENFGTTRAPWHIAGKAHYRSDIFSFGCVLWMLMDPHRSCTGVVYRDEPGRGGVLVESQDANFDLDKLKLLIPDLYSDQLVSLVKWCLEPQIHHRPSATDLLNEFNAYMTARVDGPGADGGRSRFDDYFCNDICKKLRKDCTCRPQWLKALRRFGRP